MNSEERNNIIDCVDLEEYSKDNKKVPHAQRYKIKIDKEKYETSKSAMTGREILTLAGKSPPDRYMLSQKFHMGQIKEIGLEETVDFTTPGIEKFMTIPLDQTEG